MIRRLMLVKSTLEVLAASSPVVVFQMAKDESKLFRKKAWHRLRIFLKYHFRRQEKEPVFVIAKRRSGSNLLLSYLNSVPELSFIPPEPLNSQMYYGIPEKGISKRTLLNHLAYSLNDNPTKICGFKMLFFRLKKYNLTLDDIRMRFPKAKFLILYRRSTLEQFVSFKIAEKTNHWLWTRDFKLPGSLKPDLGEFRDFCELNRNYYAQLFQYPWLRTCSRVLAYEDLAADPQRVFDEKIFPFLRLPSFPVSTTMVKQNSKPLEELLENFKELKLFEEKFDFEASWPSVSSPQAFGERSIQNVPNNP